MLDETDLRLMTPQERARIARVLAELDPHPLLRLPEARRRRQIALAFSVMSCVVLAAWIGVLAVSLPATYRAGGWRGAWVGFDVALLAAFASVAWTAWRGKQLLIVCLVVTATLLCCDAWFDLMLDWGTREFPLSVLLAVVAELPAAALMILGARRLLRLTIAVAMARQGTPGPVPPLWQIALFGNDRDSRTRRPPSARSGDQDPGRRPQEEPESRDGRSGGWPAGTAV